MTEKFKLISEFVKDMSSETPDVETFLFVKDNIKKYHLDIEINTKPLKNKIIEINTTLKFSDKDPVEKKAHFEIKYASIVKLDNNIEDKQEMQKIVLCDVQKKIYPNLEKAFLNMLSNSGYKDISFQKKIDFDQLYNERFN
jgi:preprotein translocase subunit SecB